MTRIIFSYWHQGFAEAPPLVRSCIQTFQSNHSGWDLQLLDASTVADLIDPMPLSEEKWRQLTLPHQSDLIRTQLLARYGGVWADPTVWFCKSLDEWLPQVMDAGVFMFHRPGRDRAISNWFIAAEAGNSLLQMQYEHLCAFWNENDFDNLDGPGNRRGRFLIRVLNRNLEWPRLWMRKPIIRLFKMYPYMIYHYMVYDLVRSDPEMKAIWDRMPKISADIPHFPAHKGLLEPLDEETKRFIDSGEAPLFKLTWKLPGEIVSGSVLDYLFSTREARNLRGLDAPV